MRFPFPRRAAIALCLSLGCMAPAMAEVSITYSIPGASFGLQGALPRIPTEVAIERALDIAWARLVPLEEV